MLLLYTRRGIFFALAVAAFTALVLSRLVPPHYMLLWLGLLAGVNGLRLYLIQRGLKRGGVAAPGLQELLPISLASLTAGACWGVLGVMIDPAWPVAYQVFVYFILAGICSGALVTHAILALDFAAFTIPVLLPSAFVLLSSGSGVHQAMGLLVLLYLAGLLYLARHYTRLQLGQYRAMGEKARLIEHLRSVNTSLKQKEDLLRGAFDSAPIGMALVGLDGLIMRVNQAMCDLSGYEMEDFIGQNVFRFTHPDDIELSRRYMEKVAAGNCTGYSIDKRYLGKRGEIIWARLTASMVRGRDGRPQYIIAQVENVTDKHKLSERLRHQARHDQLTGLVNRGEFDRRINRLVELASLDGSEHVLCYMDLDQFKVVNDTCGHTAGDELLRQLGQLLQLHVRKEDTLARLGGDEFGILMANCQPEQARCRAEALREAIREFRYQCQGHTFRLGCTIALVPITAGSGSAEELLIQADTTCYSAKETGPNRILIYQQGDSSLEERHGQMQWVSRIEQALDEGRFELHAQAIVPVRPGPEAGRRCEILLRMRGPDGEIISPGFFLPAAERFQIASRIDRWVVHSLVGLLESNPEPLAGIESISVNLSGLTLVDDEFLEDLAALLGDRQALSGKLCFELTETAAIADLDRAGRFIRSLQSLGCKFALDDFGSGLSSFGYLKRLPVDYLKIDGMFVRDIAGDEIDAAMVRAINEIGHITGKRTIAEFVENEAIMARLREIGVDYAQGYGVGRPIPLARFLGLEEAARA
ncbi:MAG: EAL domain-containing protein [Gammaproteobacteria bacterium]|nr:MAG: EAL domain-containing protein [Gammaproteobacteria bacterium]